MDTDLEKQCPYAPYTSVISIIRHMRKRDLKEPVTSQLITTIGIAEGNASRTIQALRFLDLLDEEGYITQNFKAIGNAPSDEYPVLLEQTLRAAYKNVFMALDPNTASDQQYENAFRYYRPKAQHSRMIMLFKGLCREASIISGGAPETVTRPRNTSTKPLNTTKKPEPKSEPSFQHDHYQPTYQTSTTTTGQLTRSLPSQEVTILEGLLHQLPFEQKRWSQARHDKWLQAMTTTVDLLFEIKDSEGEVSSPYGMNE